MNIKKTPTTMSKTASYGASLAVKAAEARGAKVIELSVKKRAKNYSGGQFLDVKWNIMGPTHGAVGNFTLRDLVLTQGAADKTDPDDARVKAKTDKYLSFGITSLGPFGTKFLQVASESASAQLQAMIDKDLIVTSKVKPIIRTHYSKKNPDSDLRGKPLDEPKVDIQLDWGNYPAKFYKKELAGQPKMHIYDADKPILNDNQEHMKDPEGNFLYEEATVEVDGDNQPINAMNAHLFLTAESTLLIADITMDTCFVGDAQVSIPIKFKQILVRKNKICGTVRVEDDANEELNVLDTVNTLGAVPTDSD